MVVSSRILLRMRNVSDKFVRKIKTHFSRRLWRLWENVEKKYRKTWPFSDDNIIRRVRSACWINKATDTHSEYVMLIAIPRQQWLRESVLVLKVHCLLKNERPTWCHLLFYFTSYVLNMFRTLIYPSSRACDCVVELPHRSSCSVKTDDLALV